MTTAPHGPQRGWALVALVLLAGTAAAGCLGGNGGAATDATYDRGAQLSGPLEVMGFGGDDEVGQVRLDAAREALGAAVDVRQVKGELDVQQFLSAIASGEAPDLVYANRNQIGTFAARGAVVPLEDCVRGEGIDLDAFREPAVAEVTLDGQLYGIPEFNVVQIVQANADLLAAEDLTLDDVDGRSWERVTRASQALQRAGDDGLSVIGFDPKLPEFLPLWARANGAALISDDGRTATLDQPAVVEALRWAVGLYDSAGGFGAVKAYRDSADFFGSGNQFAAGQLGAMPMEQWYVNVLNDVSPDAPLAFGTVRDRTSAPIAFASGSAWAVPAGAEHPEAACRFARAMTETSSWVAAAEERIRLRQEDGGLFTGLLTGNREADEQVRAMVRSSGEQVWDSAVRATYEANDHTFSMPANPAGAEFEQAWQDGVNRVLNGQQEPEEAMAQAQEDAQAALDEAWERFS